LFTKNHWYVLFAYIGMLILTFLIPVILTLNFSFDLITTSIYTNIILFILCLGLVLYMMRVELTREKRAHPLSIGTLFGWSLFGLILAWSGQIVAALIETYLFGIDPGSENTEAILELTRINPLLFIIPAIVGPILEELVFRKIIFGTFYKRMNFFLAAIFSSIIFAILHLDFSHILIYTAIGFVFAFLYVKTKRIIVPIIVHMAMNTITVLVQLSIDPEELEKIQEQLALILFGG